MTTDRTEEYLERILKLWSRGFGTFDIARLTRSSEAEVYNLISRHRDEQHRKPLINRASIVKQATKRQMEKRLVRYAGRVAG